MSKILLHFWTFQGGFTFQKKNLQKCFKILVFFLLHKNLKKKPKAPPFGGLALCAKSKNQRAKRDRKAPLWRESATSGHIAAKRQLRLRDRVGANCESQRDSPGIESKDSEYSQYTKEVRGDNVFGKTFIFLSIWSEASKVDPEKKTFSLSAFSSLCGCGLWGGSMGRTQKRERERAERGPRRRTGETAETNRIEVDASANTFNYKPYFYLYNYLNTFTLIKCFGLLVGKITACCMFF